MGRRMTTRRVVGSPGPGGGPGPLAVFVLATLVSLLLAVGLAFLMLGRGRPVEERGVGRRVEQVVAERAVSPVPERAASPRPPASPPEGGGSGPEQIWLAVAREKYERVLSLAEREGAFETPEIRGLLQALLRSYGDTIYGRKARELQGRLAPLKTPRVVWVMKGFPNQGWRGYAAVYGPETRSFDAAEEVDGRRWQRLQAAADGRFDLLPGTWQAAYAYFTISSPRAQRARFYLGTDDSAKMWLNGRLLYTYERERAAVRYADRVEGDLRAGENRVLLKVCQGGGAWGFYVDVAARDIDFGP